MEKKYPVCLSGKLLIIFVCIVNMACKKNEVDQSMLPVPRDSIQKINRWILDSMLYYYLGSDQITSYPPLEQASEDFFQSLLLPGDSFSWISNGADISPAKNTYERFGFHYVFIKHPELSDNLVGVVTLVAPGSAAEISGLTRGNYFIKVNDQAITTQNIPVLVEQLKEKNCKITTAINQNNMWTEESKITLPTRLYEDRPVFSRKIFKKAGVHTGYLFCNNFNELFDKDILDAIDLFRKDNITELILDLRYNGGGSVASSSKLSAAILGSLVNANTGFIRYRGNKHWGTFSKSFEDVISTSSNNYRKSFAQLVVNSLSVRRILILTGEQTASAAELMVNNLKPYISVIQIGEKTFGKNKAGVLIEDTRQPKEVYWYMQPIVFEIFNANNEGNYSNGIDPQYKLFEYSQLPLENIGNSNELLVAKALTIIYGDNEVDAQILRARGVHVNIAKENFLYNSMNDQEKGSILIERPHEKSYINFRNKE